jgi:phospholipase/carboxylesterase
MWVFSSAVPPGWGIVAPRAPHRIGDGYSWTTSTGRAPFAEFVPAIRALAEFLPQAVASVEGNADRVVLAGFSQGGALVLSSLLSGVGAIGGAVLAGFLPKGAEGALAGVPIFWAHGRFDRDVPFDEGVADAERVRQAGGRVEFCEGDVDHRVGAACMRGLSSWFLSLPVSPSARPSDVP